MSLMISWGEKENSRLMKYQKILICLIIIKNILLENWRVLNIMQQKKLLKITFLSLR